MNVVFDLLTFEGPVFILDPEEWAVNGKICPMNNNHH